MGFQGREKLVQRYKPGVFKAPKRACVAGNVGREEGWRFEKSPHTWSQPGRVTFSYSTHPPSTYAGLHSLLGSEDRKTSVTQSLLLRSSETRLGYVNKQSKKNLAL